MSVVGEQIKLARLRRNLSVAQVAERATCSPLTVSRIEKGIPTVAIGIYLRVLYALQLDNDLLWLPKEDKLGKTLSDLSILLDSCEDYMLNRKTAQNIVSDVVEAVKNWRELARIGNSLGYFRKRNGYVCRSAG